MLSNSLVIPAVAFVLFLTLLVWSAIHLIRANRSDDLVAAGMAPEQEITLPSSGDVVVLMEVPRLAQDFRSFQIQLVEKQTGQAVLLKYSYLTAQEAVYGVGMMKVPFGRMPAARAGTYLLRIVGLLPGNDYSRYRLILSRPYIGRMAVQIIGIVIGGVGMLLCVIYAAWVAGLMKPG
jgi:hypothetical protein